MKKIHLFLLSIVVLLGACRSDVDEETTISSTQAPEFIQNYSPKVDNIIGDLGGQVLLKDGTPAVSASVWVGSDRTTTDEFGFFTLESINLNTYGTLVRASLPNMIDGSRRFYPVEGKQNRVILTVLDKNSVEQFDNASGGTVTLEEGGTVVFPANSIVTADGDAYTGMVNAIHHYLQPTETSILDRMPGSLVAVRTDLSEVALETYGMFNVTLEGENGEALQIAEGYEAEISMPVYEEMGNVPSEMPLWSYHEELGVWVEDGKVNKVGDYYVGTVSHFSWWNCDYPYPLARLSLTIETDTDTPLRNYRIGIQLENSQSWVSYTYSDSLGFVSGLVPVDQELTLVIIGICGEELYTQNLGIITEDTDLGTVNLPSSSLSSTTVSGTLVDCDGNVVTDGLAVIKYGNGSYAFGQAIDDGTFDFEYYSCEESMDYYFIGYDYESLTGSSELSLVANENNDLGQVSACDVVLPSNTLTIDLGGEIYEYRFPDVSAELGANNDIRISVQGTVVNDSTAYHSLNFIINGNTPGDYGGNNSMNWVVESRDGFYISEEESSNSSEVFTLENCTVTEVSNKVEGNFSGAAWKQSFSQNTAEQVNISGTFSIEL